jgi:hypothetical protein
MRAGLEREREQETTRIGAVLACLVGAVIVQVVLLLVGVEALAKGDIAVLTFSTLASGLGLASVVWVLIYGRR